MEEIQILEAVERYILGEMNEQERSYFEELRRTNPEVDQMVVSHTMFLEQLGELGDRKRFRSSLQEIHTDLLEKGSIKAAEPKAKVVDIFRKYGKVMIAAACIAGVIAFSISGLVALLTPKGSVSDIMQLKLKLNKVERSQNEQKAIINDLQNTTTASTTPTRPVMTPGKFGGTGFLIRSNG